MKSAILIILLILIGTTVSFSQSTLKDVKKLIQERQFDSAKPILKSLYAKNDEDPEVNYWFGVYSLMQNNYDDAIDYLDAAIEENEKNARYHNLLGNAYGMKAQQGGMLKAAFAAPKAKSCWEKALELKPDYLDAKSALFQYYLNAPGVMGGDKDNAKQLAEKILKLHPPLGHSYFANYYFIADNNSAKAEHEIQESLNIDTTDSLYNRVININVGLLNRIGYSYLNNKNYSESKKAFKKAIELRPEAANPYDSMGDYYVARAQYDSALISYDLAILRDSNFVVSKFNKGKMLEKLNRKQEAVLVYKDIIKNHTDSDYADQAEDRLDELEQ